MKRIILIIFIALVFSANVFAGDRNDRASYLKPLTLNDKHKLYKENCDLCACYLGIDPAYNMNSFGVRYSRFTYSRDAVLAETSGLTDHPGHDGTAEVKETYANIELYGKYYLSPTTRIMFNIPYSLNTIDGKSIKDISDITVLAQYQLYNTEVEGDTKFRHRVFVGGGLKLPTGSYNKSLQAGVLDPHIQAGTGSVDFMGSVTYLAWLSGLGWSTDLIYTLNTTNKNEYKFANRLNITSSFFYKFETGKTWALLPHAGFYLENAGNDKQNNIEVAGTSSNSFFATGGLDLYFKQFSLNFTYQHPVSQSFGTANHPENDNRFFIGLGFSFD